MSREYTSPAVDIFESEQLPDFTPEVVVRYGIVGATTKGPFVPTEVTSVSQLHYLYGYAALGELNGNKIYSMAIVAAERILKNRARVMFCRMNPQKEELKKLKVTGDLNFTVANNDLGVKAVIWEKVDGDEAIETLYNVYVSKINPKGDLIKELVCTGVPKGDIVEALGASDYFEDVTIAETFPGFAGNETSKTVAIASDPLSLVLDYSEIELFSNTDAVDVSCLICPIGNILEAKNTGEASVDNKKLYTDVNAKLCEVASERSDCMVILDYPNGIKKNEFITLLSSSEYKALDNSEACTFYPQVVYHNQYSDVDITLPASVAGTGQFAFTDSVSQYWFAAAGFGDKKGVVSDAIELTDTLTKADRDKIYALRANPIVSFVGKGIVVWGNRTFKVFPKYGTPSMYTKLNVRRLINYVRKLVMSVSLDTLFDPHDPIAWKNWRGQIENRLEIIRNARGIEDYKVVMDRTTVTDEDLANGVAPGSVYVLPIGAIEYIPVNCIVTQDRTIFVEEEEGGEV